MLSIIVYWGQMKFYIFACSIAYLLVVSWTALLQHSWLIFVFNFLPSVFCFVLLVFFGLILLNMLLVTWKLPSTPQSIWFLCFVSGSYNSGKNILKITFKRYHWYFRNHPGGGISVFSFEQGFCQKMCFDGRSAAVLVSESTIPARQAVQSEVIWLKFISVSQA